MTKLNFEQRTELERILSFNDYDELAEDIAKLIAARDKNAEYAWRYKDLQK